MKARFLSLVPFLFTLFVSSTVLAKPPGPSTRTIWVDCQRGGSIARALRLPAHRLVIRVKGVCKGDVQINRDRVTLQGIGAGATLVGDSGAPGPVVEISAASEVDLMDLTVRGGDASGVVVQRNGEARLERVRIVESSAIGLLLDLGSSALLVDSVMLDHPFFGAAVFGSSGLTVQGANEFSGNGQIGLLMSDGASLSTQGEGTLTADDNGAIGIVLQSGAAGVFPSAIARRNSVAGLQIAFAASFSSIGNDNDLSDNGAFGAFLFDNSHLSLAGNIRNNPVAGILASEGSVVSVASDMPSQIDGSPVDVILEGAIGTFDAVNIESIELTFGTRVTFGPEATVSSLFCDSTVLTRGLACPPAAATSDGLVATEGVSSVIRQRPGLRRLFQRPSL